MTTTTSSTRPPFTVKSAEYKAQFSWKVYAYEISRQPGRSQQPVRSRRVVVYAPLAAAALFGAGVSRDERARQVSPYPWEHFGVSAQPKRQEVADFFEALGSSLGTGASLSSALNLGARMARSPRFRGIIGTLSYFVSQGEALHVGMSCFPRTFVPMHLAMMEAASETGLDQASHLIVTLAERIRAEGKLLGKLISGLAYPLTLLGATGVGSIILEVFALPPMVRLFKALNGTLPPLTAAFYQVALFLHSHWVALVAGLLAGTGLLVAAMPSILRSRAFQVMVVRLYVIGPAIQRMALARGLSTFSMLKKSGAKVRDQFLLAASASGNCVVGDFFEACYQRIGQGETVEEAFTAERHRLGEEDGLRVAGRMEVGMAGGDIDELLQKLVDEMTDQADQRIALIPTLLRWPLLLICAGLIGIVALAIILPYPSLIADVVRQQGMGG